MAETLVQLELFTPENIVERMSPEELSRESKELADELRAIDLAARAADPEIRRYRNERHVESLRASLGERQRFGDYSLPEPFANQLTSHNIPIPSSFTILPSPVK